MTTAPEDSTTSGRSRPADSPSSDEQDAADGAALLRSLATSIALLPQVPAAEGEERPDGAIALPVIEQAGRRYIPVFTTEEALQAAGADPGTALHIPLVELAANWPSDDVWLAVNPATEEGLGLPPDVVRALPVFAGQHGHGTGNGAGPDPASRPA
ncbi:MAG TPA: SseB family protein [Blastococcus sp.]